VLACNVPVDKATATAIHEIFFEVLIAPAFDADRWRSCARKRTGSSSCRRAPFLSQANTKSLLNGVLLQQHDEGNIAEWKEAGGRNTGHSGKRRPRNSPI